MNRRRLDEAIFAIREYTSTHPELQASHHFLFDLPLQPGAETPEVVVMGINTGESQFDRDSYPGPTEETSSFDFHAQSTFGRSKGSVRWRKYAEYFASGRSVVMTELFFWSSRNSEEFVERFGPLESSPHLKFCVDLNRRLIEEYQPSAVIFPGLGKAQMVAKEFGLRHVESLHAGGKRLVLHYRDSARSWYFTQHWTAAHGLSNADKAAIQNYIQQTA